MTSRERFLTAVANGIPDRVPCTPDISNYIPAKRTGLPFWEVYFTEKVPLWRAYQDAAAYFGLDMWVASCIGIPVYDSTHVQMSEEIFPARDRDAMIQRRTWYTPDGSLTEESICFRQEPPTHLKRVIEEIERDWPRYRWLLMEEPIVDFEQIAVMREATLEREQAFGLSIGYSGFQHWEQYIEGSIITLTYLLSDAPEILDEWMDLQLAQDTKLVEAFLSTKPDYLTLGGSGTLTLASPELARRYALPAIKLFSAMAKEAGVLTVLHSCGRSRELVEMLAEETDVNCFNPLEVAPMGDADLGEVKRTFGDKIALMGNLHTTDMMLRGSRDDVYEAAREALLAAREGGGFILSTGDQCPRDTPEENLFVLQDAIRDFGRYDT